MSAESPVGKELGNKSKLNAAESSETRIPSARTHRKSLFNHHSPRTKNVGKFFSYTEAWTRIRVAQEQGFFLEAVTLEEAIISDRLFGYLVAAGALSAIKEGDPFPSFNSLIQQWKKLNPQPISLATIVDLQGSVDAWRKERNRVVHGMVKSNPGHPTERIEDFLATAELIASDGARLARLVARWCKKARKAQQGVVQS